MLRKLCMYNIKKRPKVLLRFFGALEAPWDKLQSESAKKQNKIKQNRIPQIRESIKIKYKDKMIALQKLLAPPGPALPGETVSLVFGGTILEWDKNWVYNDSSYIHQVTATSLSLSLSLSLYIYIYIYIYICLSFLFLYRHVDILPYISISLLFFSTQSL